MSEAQHTPGPWRIENHGDTGTFVIVGGTQRDNGPLTYVAVTRGQVCERRDARLIEAAPELLEQLEDMTAQHACGCEHPACNRCADDYENRRIIGKAKGES